MNPVQYIILDHTLNMSVGKAAAQSAHAAIEGLRLNAKEPWGNPWDASIVNRWYQGGHHAKVVLEADYLLVAYSYLSQRGFEGALVIDEGRTEFNGGLTPTAIGYPVLDKDEPHVRESFGAFKLYGSAARKKVDDDLHTAARVQFSKPHSSTPRWYRSLWSGTGRY
jgi:peptidyl-tRNA hydrolase